MRLAVRLLLAQGADVTTFLAFYIFIGAGVHEEKGGAAVVIMSILGIWGVAAVKLGDAAWIAWRFVHPPKLSRYARVRRFNELIRVHRWWQTVGVILISAGAASGIAGAGFNLASIIHTLMVR